MSRSKARPNGRHSPPIVIRDGAPPSAAVVPSQGRRTPEEARREIIEVGRAYLAKHGFQGLTVGRLMQGTRIGRSAFYVYFKDVYDLAATFLLELSDQISAGGAVWFDEGGPPAERFRAVLLHGILFWEKNGRMIRALEVAAQQDARLRELWRTEIAMRPVQLVAKAIRRDQAAGLIGPMDALEMSMALNRFNMTYLNDCFGKGRPKNRDLVLQTLERVWVGTLFGRIPAPKRATIRKTGIKAP